MLSIITPELIIAITGLVSVIGAIFQRRRARRERERQSQQRRNPYSDPPDDAYYEYLENPSVPPAARTRRKRTKQR